MKNRESSFELLRIILMFFIVVWHILLHGKVVESVFGTTPIVLKFLEALIIVHVDTFVILTGFFQYKTEISIKKIFALNNAAWFYRVVIIILLSVFSLSTADKIQTLNSFLPIDMGFYWFLDKYIVLYLLSPFLNMLINVISKKDYQKLLLTTFVLYSLLATVTMDSFVNSSNGYSVSNFILLYFIGAYIGKYGLFKFSVLKARVYYVLAYLFMASTNFILMLIGENLMTNYKDYTYEFGRMLRNSTFSYSNPIIIIQSVALFMIFKTFSFKNKFINYISPLIFGVYLIHDNHFLRGYIYQFFGFNNGTQISGFPLLIRVFAVAIIIFTTCVIIELVRQQILLKLSKLLKFAKNKITILNN